MVNRALAGAVALIACMAVNVAGGAEALDQSLIGNPDCPGQFSTGINPGSSGSVTQGAVPAAEGLAAVEVCIASLGPVSDVRLLVRVGTVDAPGPVIAAASARVTGRAFAWVRFELIGAVATEPGRPIVLQVQRTAGDSFRWAISCDEGSEPCTDAYPAGASNAAAGDFVFRTFGDEPAYPPLVPRSRAALLAR